MKVTRINTDYYTGNTLLALGIKLGINGLQHEVGEYLYSDVNICLSNEVIAAIQVLAMDKGEDEGYLDVWVDIDWEQSTVTNLHTGLVIQYVNFDELSGGAV